MAYSAAATVTIGTATLASEYDLLGANDDYLQGLSDVEHYFDVSTGTGIHKDVICRTSAATTSLTIDNLAADGDPYLAFQLSGTSKFCIGVDDGDSDKFKIGTTAIGTGTFFTATSAGAVTFASTLGAGATTVTTLVTSGNMGIKVTPETWFASYAVEQLGGNAFLASTTTPAASNDFLIGLNAYLSAGGSWTKISDDEASRYYQQNGSHVFQSAASGTGTFSWTTAANFDISGMNGVLGATTPAAATVTTLTTGGQLNARQGSVGVGSHSILLGADVNATTVTNVTRKIGIISTPHYTIAEEPVGGLYTDVDNGTNAVNIGGGYSTLNAATTVRIYAAADATTQTGTSVALFDVSGMNGVLGATTPAAATVTTLGASGNITSSNGVLSMTKSQDAASGHILLNNNSHTTASSYLRMQSNAASAYLFAFSTAYTTSARAIADGVLLVADVNSAGGLALASDHATADISF